MTYKTKEKSFFEKTIEEEIVKPVQETKEDLQELEKKGAKKVLKWYDFGASSLRDEIKRRPAQYFFLFVTSFIGSALTTGAALIIFSGNLIAQFVPKPVQKVESSQTVKTPVEVSKYDPLLLASKLKKNESDFELVDVRSASDFGHGHIINAINIPVYSTDMVGKSGDLNRDSIKKAFEKFVKTDKFLIIYAQNAYSTIPSDIAAILGTGDKKVKALAVGWEEWLHLNK
jgi:rhodanese-related sulfurtransferase